MEGIHLHTRALTYGFSYALHKLYSMNRSGMVGRGARFDWAAEVGLDELHATANTKYRIVILQKILEERSFGFIP